MAKEKKVNYSEADVAVLRAGYTGADNKAEVAALMVQLPGKSAASIRAKLASLDLYRAEKVEKASEEKVTKEVLATAIGAAVGLADHEIEGLVKATKPALEKILAKLA